MGVYHYAMFVYSARRGKVGLHSQDFMSYAFAETHPSGKFRVQKLRVSERYRVPRLFGFTMPSEEADREGSAMFKSVLLRPLKPAWWGDDVDAYTRLVDGRGSFVGEWQEWFGQQRLLAHRYEELQDRAGKLFGVTDIDVDARSTVSYTHLTLPTILRV